jgi:hypothetical protein
MGVPPAGMSVTQNYDRTNSEDYRSTVNTENVPGFSRGLPPAEEGASASAATVNMR